MFATLKLAVLALTLARAGSDSTEIKADSLLKVLRKGGYTILLRHARTDYSFNESPTAVTADRATQRNLSEAGVADAKAIGAVMRSAGIPVGEILSSPMFRTRETAEMAFGAPTAVQELRDAMASREQKALIAKAPPAGTNRALVTHHFIIERYAPGIKPGEIGESEAVVLRTETDGTIRLVGRFTRADWERLSGGRTGAANAPEGHQPPRRAPDVAPGSAQAFVEGATIATKLAAEYVRTFNTGDGEQMRAFIERSLVADPKRPTADRVETYRGSFKQFGTLTIHSLTSASATEAVITVRAANGDFTLTVTMSAEQPGRAASVRMAGPQ